MSQRHDTQRRIEGFALLAAFALTIPFANWMIGHVGVMGWTTPPAGSMCQSGGIEHTT
jgi:hypothetical protein